MHPSSVTMAHIQMTSPETYTNYDHCTLHEKQKQRGTEDNHARCRSRPLNRMHQAHRCSKAGWLLKHPRHAPPPLRLLFSQCLCLAQRHCGLHMERLYVHGWLRAAGLLGPEWPDGKRGCLIDLLHARALVHGVLLQRRQLVVAICLLHFIEAMLSSQGWAPAARGAIPRAGACRRAACQNRKHVRVIQQLSAECSKRQLSNAVESAS